MTTTVYTIGHSTHPIEEFTSILKAHRIEVIADVRTIAKSRHNPQFAEDQLRISLPESGIKYIRLEKLGGLRRPVRDSVNTAWRNKSFQGYADYMQTDGFAEGLDQLKKLAGGKRVAIMCAEAVPWRCHRSLVGDALLVDGFEVLDIMSKTVAKPHTLTSFAKVQNGKISYPVA